MATNPLDSSSPDTSQFISTLGLICPECDYNLTGLTEYRCPECGTPFDPDHLRELLAGKPAPLPCWENPAQPSVLLRYANVCRMTWFHPSEFGRQFPWSYKLGTAVSFICMSRAVTVVLIWIVIIATSRFVRMPGEAIGMACLGIPWTTGCGATICEVIFNLALRLTVRKRVQPSQVPSECSSTWYGLVCMFSTFQPLSAIVIGTYLVVMVGCDIPEQIMIYGLMILAGVQVVWWSSMLGTAVSVQAKSGLGVLMARILIPLLGALSIPLGAMCGICCLR